MAVTLNLEAEQEQLLQEIAAANGLSVEGYLLTLIAAITCPKLADTEKGFLASIKRKRNSSENAPTSRTLAENAVRQMKADLLIYKEQAVEAGTKVNLLRKHTEQQQRKISELELRSLTFARDGDKDKALRCFQESCIYGQNLKHTLPQLEEAGKIADELLADFTQKDTKFRTRTLKSQPAANESLQIEYTTSHLTAEEIQKRILETHIASEEWDTQFITWVDSITDSVPAVS